MSETPASPPPASPGPAKGKRPLWFKLLLGFTGLVILVVAGWYLYLQWESWRSWRHWQGYKAQLEAQGEKLDVQALAPAAVPEEKNFARHPLIARWFTPEAASITNGTQRWFFAPGAEDPERRRGASGPVRSDGAGTLLERWAAYYTGHRAFPQAPAGSSPAQVVRTALSIYDADIQALQEAMKSRPTCRYPLHYELGGAVHYPHLVGCRSLVATLELRILALLHLGQVDQAFAELQLGYFVSDTLQSDPLLVSLLVRLATDQLLVDAVLEGLRQRRWNDAQLTWLTQYLGRREYLKEFAAVLRGERNFAVHQTDLLSRGQVHAQPDESELTTAGRRAMKLLPRGLYYRNLVELVHFYQEKVLPAENVPARRMDRDRLQALNVSAGDETGNPYGLEIRQLMPALYNGAVKVARWQVLGDSLLVACALERHRLARGRLPNQLQELVPQFLPALPIDCLSGKPLSWRKESEDAYRVYGWGWNNKDEGGRPGRRLEDGDWGVEVKLASIN
ncbi:MAG: hypothetical protein N3J91_02825 [Verrucomicrobiae bacterium]|nr:hypothetical protein [Verrucomicrobiae bacterium]